MVIKLDDEWYADEAFETTVGLTIYKSRELGETKKGTPKTTFRTVEVLLTNEDVSWSVLKPALQGLFKRYHKSISHAHILTYEEFEDSVLSGIRTPIMLEIKAESIFEDSYKRVVNFFGEQTREIAA